MPFSVLLSTPVAMFGGYLALWSRHMENNVYAQIGMVMLIGLAAKNAILIVEFAKLEHDRGKNVVDAALSGARLRLRPIIMTSFAFILGVVPLCVASGAGAEMRKSLGTAVFSGMLGVTAFGIFLTPVFFYVIQGLGEAKLFSGALIQWVGSCVLGGLLGAGIAYSLARLGVVPGLPRFWVVVVGICLGVLAVAAVRGIHKTISSRR